MATEKSIEQKARRKAARYGLYLRKSRRQCPSQYGGYYILDPQYNIVISPFNLDLEEAIEWIDEITKAEVKEDGD